MEPTSSPNGVCFFCDWWAYFVEVEGGGRRSRICHMYVKPSNMDEGTQVQICTFHSINFRNTYRVSNALNIPISKGVTNSSHTHNLGQISKLPMAIGVIE